MKKTYLVTYLFLSFLMKSFGNEIAIVRTKISSNWGWGQEQIISGDSVKKLELLSENLRDSWDKVGMLIPIAVVTVYDYSENKFQLKKTYYYYDEKAVDQLGVTSDARKLNEFISSITIKIETQPSPFEEAPEKTE